MGGAPDRASQKGGRVILTSFFDIIGGKREINLLGETL